ncbi:MAG: hypothetical protein E7633_03305 [Ruminococcaceae bacterium]|nr:hypothetical protein [Oscillospiraceae bacterium]
MKKTAFVLSLVLVLSIISACGNIETPPTTPDIPFPPQNDSDLPQDDTDPTPENTSKLENGAAYVIKAKNGFSIGGSSFGTVKGEMATLAKYRGDLDEIWRLSKLDDESYNIINAVSGLYLSKDASDQDKPLTLSKKDSKLLQSWSITETDGGYFITLASEERYLSGKSNSEECDAILFEKAEGAPVWEISKVFDKDDELPSVLSLSGATGAPTSCPEIIEYKGAYYSINMTAGMMVKRSPNLKTWQNCNWVFDTFPSYITEKLGNSASIWAPGFYTVGDKLCIYYCASTLGSQNSLIGLVYADSPTGPYTDMGIVIESKAGDPYNCIDPNIFVDDNGKTYLIFGSYWDGIFMRSIDPSTGLLNEKETTLWHLAKGSGGLEAPYIVKRGDYYYLFVARGVLGQDGSYHWAVGRSESLFGPYLDRDGKPMLEGNSTALTENKRHTEGVAHAQPFLDSNGQWYMVSEMWTEDSDLENNISIHISTIVWSENGWPVTALSPNIIQDLSGDISYKH